MEEFVGEDFCVHAVECGGLNSDVVEADVDGSALESTIFLLIECVSVEVVVECVVVDHLRDGEVVEEVWVVGVAEVFGEDLHKEGFAGTHIAVEQDVFVELVTSVGEYFFGKGAAVEVVEEEAEYLPVIVVDHKLAVLICEHFIGDHSEQPCVGSVDHGDFEGMPSGFGFAGLADDALNSGIGRGNTCFGEFGHSLPVVSLHCGNGFAFLLLRCIFSFSHPRGDRDSFKEFLFHGCQMSWPPNPPPKV